jgi:predicted permease
MPGWVSFGLDWRVLTFAALASLSTILLVGLWPAREGLRFDLTGALRGTADHSVTGRDPTRRLHLPVVVELMLSLALVIAAVTMLESFRAAATADRGMLMEDRYEVRMGFDERRDTAPSVYTAFLRAMRDDIAAATPGTEVAWGSSAFTIHGDSIRPQGIGIAGTTRNIGWEQFGRIPEIVSDNYFRVLGIRVLGGRSFDSSDVATSPLVVVVSRRFAEDAWPGQNPLGKKLQVATIPSGQATVVGVVSDVTKQDRMANGELARARDVYFSERQGLTCCNRARLIVHTRVPMNSLSRVVQSQLTALGRDLPVYPRPLREAETVEGEMTGRLLSPVLGTFAVAGFILAILGIYGVVSFAVERRVREIGVRIALGATQRDIVRHMMRDGLTLIAIGITGGLAAAAALSRLFSAFIMGPVTSHLWSALAVSALFGGIAVVACYLPARRSAALDPLAALRSE